MISFVTPWRISTFLLLSLFHLASLASECQLIFGEPEEAEYRKAPHGRGNAYAPDIVHYEDELWLTMVARPLMGMIGSVWRRRTTAIVGETRVSSSKFPELTTLTTHA